MNDGAQKVGKLIIDDLQAGVKIDSNKARFATNADCLFQA